MATFKIVKWLENIEKKTREEILESQYESSVFL